MINGDVSGAPERASAFGPFDPSESPVVPAPEQQEPKRRKVEVSTMHPSLPRLVEDVRTKELVKGASAVVRYTASGPFEEAGVEPQLPPGELFLLQMERLREPHVQTKKIVRGAVKSYGQHWNSFKEDKEGCVSPNTMIKATRVVDEFLRLSPDKQNMSPDTWGDFGDLFEGVHDCSAVLQKVSGRNFNSLTEVNLFASKSVNHMAGFGEITGEGRKDLFARYASIQKCIWSLLPSDPVDQLTQTYW